MLYLCHLVNGRGQDITQQTPDGHPWVIKSHKAHIVGDLLLAWHDHYGLCTFSVQGFYLRNDHYESIAIPAVYNLLELKELINE